MDIRFKNTEDYIKSFAESKLVQYFLESYETVRSRSGKVNSQVRSSGAGGDSLNVKVENNGLDINLYGNSYLEAVDEGTAPFSPPPEAIINWLKTKPVTLTDFKTGRELKQTPANLRSVAYKIGDSIRANGIAPANYIKEVVERGFDEILNGITEPLGKDIKEKLDTILTKVGYVKKGDNWVLKTK
jgi:hypothetical protein